MVARNTNGLTKKYPGRLNTTHAVSTAMLALTCTAVSVIQINPSETDHKQIHCALEEWRDGRFKPIKFSSNTYTSTYDDHVKNLDKIMADNRAEYNILTSSILTRAMLVSIVVLYSMLMDVAFQERHPCNP